MNCGTVRDEWISIKEYGSNYTLLSKQFIVAIHVLLLDFPIFYCLSAHHDHFLSISVAPRVPSDPTVTLTLVVDMLDCFPDRIQTSWAQ